MYTRAGDQAQFDPVSCDLEKSLYPKVLNGTKIQQTKTDLKETLLTLSPDQWLLDRLYTLLSPFISLFLSFPPSTGKAPFVRDPLLLIKLNKGGKAQHRVTNELRTRNRARERD